MKADRPIKNRRPRLDATVRNGIRVSVVKSGIRIRKLQWRIRITRVNRRGYKSGRIRVADPIGSGKEDNGSDLKTGRVGSNRVSIGSDWYRIGSIKDPDPTSITQHTCSTRAPRGDRWLVTRGALGCRHVSSPNRSKMAENR